MDNKLRYISKIDRSCKIYKRRKTQSNQLSESETQVLHYIRHHQGTSQDSIAKYLEVDKALVTRIIKHLIELELVERKQSEIDKRVNAIYSTAKAEELKNESNLNELKFYEYLIEGLDEQELEAFFKVLDKLYIKSKKARKNDYEEIK